MQAQCDADVRWGTPAWLGNHVNAWRLELMSMGEEQTQQQPRIDADAGTRERERSARTNESPTAANAISRSEPPSASASHTAPPRTPSPSSLGYPLVHSTLAALGLLDSLPAFIAQRCDDSALPLLASADNADVLRELMSLLGPRMKLRTALRCRAAAESAASAARALVAARPTDPGRSPSRRTSLTRCRRVIRCCRSRLAFRVVRALVSRCISFIRCPRAVPPRVSTLATAVSLHLSCRRRVVAQSTFAVMSLPFWALRGFSRPLIELPFAAPLCSCVFLLQILPSSLRTCALPSSPPDDHRSRALRHLTPHCRSFALCSRSKPCTFTRHIVVIGCVT